VPTFGIRAVVEETGWSKMPWLKRVCKEDLRKTMGDRGKSTVNDSGRLIKKMTVTGVWLMLTHTNYVEWALLMQVNLKGMEVWHAMDPGGGSHKNDCVALGALLQGVPPETWSLLTKKRTAKEAWEAVRSMIMSRWQMLNA
jgi:hypothetical protein